MRYAALFRIFSLLLMFFSLSMLPPLGVSIYYHDSAWKIFVISFLLTILVGFILWVVFRSHERELKTRDGFLLVVLLWTVFSFFGAIPFLMQLYLKLTFTDAIFETLSGLTTTGATVLSHFDRLPRSILYYRQQLPLLGGMSIIVLAVAVMPMLGVGGMQLYRAETMSSVKTNKLKPRIAETAKVLWYIYVGLVVLCALSYWFAGMSLFDAIVESYSTISTGGFSIHSNSFAYYHNNVINCIAIFFMITGATNFGLHFYFLQRRHFSVYYRDAEFIGFIKIIFYATLIVIATLTIYHAAVYKKTFIDALFTVTSVLTTTGFTITDFNQWPTFLPYFMMFLALLGGCAASTAGGIKIIRYLLLREQGRREIKRLIHPQAVFSVRFSGEALPENVVQSIWAFFSVFFVLFVLLILILLTTGVSMTTAFGAVAASLSNTGAAIGQVSETYAHISTLGKWVLIAAMLLGRLEIFTILVLFSPEYWRK